jgi:class 3 adenylate cyclase
MTESRRLAAILAADIAGYSALMGIDEVRTVRDLKAHQAAVLPLVSQFGGRIIDTAGDGILAEFASVVNAVECAVNIQNTIAERNTPVEPARRMQFRIGINIGDVIYDDARIYGDGINIAARLEGIAAPGGICISRQAYDHIDGKLALGIRSLGPQNLKNIARPVEVFCRRYRCCPRHEHRSESRQAGGQVLPRSRRRASGLFRGGTRAALGEDGQLDVPSRIRLG